MMRDPASPRYVSAAVAAFFVSAVVYADPARGVFPVVLRDQSCENVAASQSDAPTDCNPDVVSWTASDGASGQQNVATAQNINSPNSWSYANSTSP
jgi:hypothetical protein